MEDKPFSRAEYNRALVTNALLDTFNVVLLAAVLIVGIVIGEVGLLAPIAVVLYLAGAARTYFDSDVAEKVLEREKAKRQKTLKRTGPAPLDVSQLTPGIGRIVMQARQREAQIRQAIAGADDPDIAQIGSEVDGFVVAIEETARRAQSLADVLRDTPVAPVQQRLDQVKGDPAKKELADALATQLQTLERMRGQLARFGDEMERILVELDTIRGQIVSLGATTGNAKGTELAGEVRSLREQVGAVADGMSAAYENTTS